MSAHAHREKASSAAKAAPPNVRITPESYAALHALAEREGVTMLEALSRAVHALRREVFFRDMAAADAAVRADPKAWAEEQVEARLWDQTSGDGLEEEPSPEVIPDAPTPKRSRASAAKRVLRGHR